MSVTDPAAWVSAIGGVIAAIFTAAGFGAAVWAAFVARGAASTWRGVHEHAKADECVAAAYDLAHAVNRFVDERIRVNDQWNAVTDPYPFPGEAYDATWAAWRRFQTAHVVAFRYYAARMDREAPKRLAETLDGLKPWAGSVPRDMSRLGMPFDNAPLEAAKAEGKDIKDRFWGEAETIDAALMPPRGGVEGALSYIGRPGRDAWYLPKL